jgi:hypothetical protein
MAQTTGPLFSMSAQGTIGNALTFQSWKGRNTTRQRPVPANPKTIAQRQARTWIMILNAIWRQVSDANREGWQAQADQGQYTKFNAFNSVNLNRRTNGLYPLASPIWTAPSVQATFDVPSWAGGAGQLEWSIFWDNPPEPTDLLYLSISTVNAADTNRPSAVIFAQFLDGSDHASYIVEQLPPGTYFARAQTRDMNGNLGQASVSGALVVT